MVEADYKKHIINNFGETKGGEIYERAKERGEAHRRRASEVRPGSEGDTGTGRGEGENIPESEGAPAEEGAGEGEVIAGPPKGETAPEPVSPDYERLRKGGNIKLGKLS